MRCHIELFRRFRDLTQTELEDPELLASLNDHNYLSPIEWSELLEHPRVLLLAEAGSGKTWEMRAQAKHLAAQGKFAFFIPLEALAQDSLVDSLEVGEESSFLTWKSDQHSNAWFFLDAVDELKLKQGSFERALNRVTKGIEGCLDRAYIMVSCRPTDWRPYSDIVEFQNKLPIAKTQTVITNSPEDIFLSPLRRNENTKPKQEADKNKEPKPIRAVVLLPMSERQIEIFARGSGIENTQDFIAEINIDAGID